MQEFNFKVIYKLGKVHVVPNQLSHARNGELVVGMEDQLFDVVIFILTSDWYTPIKEYLGKGYFEDDVPKEERKHLIIKSRLYTFYGEKIYKLGPNGIFQ